MDLNGFLPEEQKGCRKNCRGTHDLLYIDRMIPREVKRRNRDYFMVAECVRFLFTSCERSLNERVSAANE